MQTQNVHDRYRLDIDKTVELLSNNYAGLTIDELAIELEGCAQRRVYRIFKYLRQLGLILTHEAPVDISRSDVANMNGDTGRLLAHRYRIVNPEIYNGSTGIRKATVFSVHFSAFEMGLIASCLQSVNGKHAEHVKSLWEKLQSIGDKSAVEIADVEPTIELIPDNSLSEYLHLVGTGKQITMRLRDDNGKTCCRITGMALGVQMIGARIQWKVSIISKGGSFPRTGVEEKSGFVLIDSVNISEVNAGRIHGCETGHKKVS